MQEFKYNKPIDVRYADVDLMGHVNNAKYLTFIEHARGDYFRKACNWDWSKQGMVLARTEIDFKKPVLLHHRPIVWIRTIRLGKTSFTQQNIIAEAGQPGIVYAEAISVLVHVDYASGRPLPIPEKIKTAIQQYDEGLE
jgi:acyl-CoA thioester hydrolase